MEIDNKIINKLFNIKVTEKINCKKLGLITDEGNGILSYFADNKYQNFLNNRKGITAIFTTKNLAKLITKKSIKKIIFNNPILSFYKLHNYIARQSYLKKETTIGEGSIIDKTSFISKYNVKIGKQVIIEPNVTILPDVEIGDKSIVRANSVIGVEGFEFKRTSERLIGIVHDGKVIIKERVHIGANNTIAKGFMHRDTIIDEETKLDNLVHVAHRVHIGKRCLIAPGVVFAGSVTVKDDVFVGLGVNISNRVILHDKSFISIGSVVTKSVNKGTQVTGNFAMPHKIFIRNLKKML